MRSITAPTLNRHAPPPMLPGKTNSRSRASWLLLLMFVVCGLACLYLFYSAQRSLGLELEEARDRINQLTSEIEATEQNNRLLTDMVVGAHIRASEYLHRDNKTKLEELQNALAMEGVSPDTKLDIQSRIGLIPSSSSLPDGLTFSGVVTAASPSFCTIEFEPSLVGQTLERDQFVLRQASKRLHHVALYEIDQRLGNTRYVYLLIDQSGSTKEVMREVKQATASFVQGLPEVASVKLAAFNDSLRPLTQWTNNGSELEAAVQQLRADGGTALQDSLLEAIRELSAKSGTKSLIVLSDGRDSKQNSDFAVVSKAALSGGIEITTIGINTPQDHTELLRSLAAKTGGMSFNLKNIGELTSHFSSIARKLKAKRYRFVVLDPLDATAPITIEANNGHLLELQLPK